MYRADPGKKKNQLLEPFTRDSPIPIDERGKCVVATEIPCDTTPCPRAKCDVQEYVESESTQYVGVRGYPEF